MKKILFAAVGLLISLSAAMAQQQQMKPEEREKKMEEFIQKEVERMESSLKLEDWQVFYVDSILHHDYKALDEELQELQAAKVSNSDLFTKASDKWEEQIYNSIHGVLNDNQWEKYLKSGAARQKKSRDKRKAKMN